MFNIKNQKGVASGLLIIIVIGLALAVGIGWYAFSGWEEEEREEGPEKEKSEVLIEETFVDKIVYTAGQKADAETLRGHCEEEGGAFNECGTVCGPGTDMCASVCAYTCEFEEIDLSEWEKFENKEYGFRLMYPSDWNMEGNPDDPLSPKFSFYLKPAGVPVTAPFDHFANINHVSLYPLGIPTEGVLGQRKQVGPGLSPNLENSSKIYVLEEGTPFAAYLQFEDVPDKWNQSGFVWARLRIENLVEKCERKGELIPMEECSPLAEGDKILRTGSVDEDVWDIQKAVIRSIKFISTENEEAKVRIESPEPQEKVSSPLNVRGEARGTWYFEASFPVILVDWDGRIIGEAPAQAEEDWMTEGFVPFEAAIEFESPYQEGDPEFMKRGTLILQKANPSGLPENDDAVEVPVFFE